MNHLTQVLMYPSQRLSIALAFLTLFLASLPGYAQQTGPSHQSHAANLSSPSSDDASLAEQLRQLQSKIAQLEAALQRSHQAASVPAQQGAPGRRGMGMMAGREMGSMGSAQPGQGPQGGRGMGMMQRGQGTPAGGGMGMMEQEGMGMDAMEMSGGAMQPGQGMRGMGMEDMGMGGMGMMAQDGMGMGSMQSGRGVPGGRMGMMEREGMTMMGQMQGMAPMQMQSALPGFPGASHIYHIGATGFFLDHPQHITLTQEQQAALSRIREQSLLEQSTYDRSIAQAEQELWVLTSSDSPDINQIEAKVREIEKLRGDKRIAFIRAVGEAAGALTDQERQTLVGAQSSKPLQ